MRQIVITGGPHAGKTDFLPQISEYISWFGKEVFIIPEKATELYNNGIHPSFENISGIDFQTEIIKKYLLSKEEILNAIKMNTIDKVVIICDRRIPDCSAYLTKEEYLTALQRNNLSLGDALDGIHGILHLETTALGTNFYDELSNPARIGTSYHRAIELDGLTKLAYKSYAGHKITITNPIQIPNAHDLDTRQLKLDAVLQGINKLIT